MICVVRWLDTAHLCFFHGRPGPLFACLNRQYSQDCLLSVNSVKCMSEFTKVDLKAKVLRNCTLHPRANPLNTTAMSNVIKQL